MVVVQLREPLPGCAAPSRIGESNLSRRSWRSGGAAAAADSARLGARGRQASAAPIGCGARGAAVLIIIFQPRRCRAPLTARRARGRGLGLPGQLARGSDRSPRLLGLPGCSGFWPPSPPPPAPSRAPSRPRRQRPRLLSRCSSALRSWGPRCPAGRVARGAHFSAAGGEWLVVLLGDGLLTMNQENLRSNFREKGKGSSLCTIGNRQFSSAPEFCVEPRLQPVSAMC
ncbi:uncharacterized protein [Equus przewalskii]|uniref:Uncharacterized protein n=1 Tax=Equus przewalskii TaxID=9798 RepID=A0ABM4LPV1_EQUPR